MPGKAEDAEIRADIAIVGAGPVGLFAVFECGMLGMSCVVLDALDQPGGQCTALYPEKPIYDIPGHPRLDAGELIARLEAQAAPFKPRYLLGERVEALTAQGADWALATSAGRRVVARAVFVAAGAGAFAPNRPPLAGLAAYEGQSVFYAVKRREDLRGQRIVIAGGGDSAVDWALSLAEVAAQVAVVHRRDHFRAAPESVARLRRLAEAGRIELAIPYHLARLEGAAGRLTAVIVADLDGAEKRLPADVLLPFYGLAHALGPIARWGLALDHDRIVVAPASCETGVPGIFAIGDIAAYPGKLKLILCGFAEAAQAAHAAFARVKPGTALHFEYSTTKGVPGA